MNITVSTALIDNGNTVPLLISQPTSKKNVKAPRKQQEIAETSPNDNEHYYETDSLLQYVTINIFRNM